MPETHSSRNEANRFEKDVQASVSARPNRDLIRIELFGGLRVLHRDRVITQFDTQRTRVLLARLAYFANREHPREVLAELIWPDEDPLATHRRLSQALSVIRAALEPEEADKGAYLVTDRVTVRLHPDRVLVDTREFGELLRSAKREIPAAERIRALTTAIELYREGLLPGYYDEWILPEQERLEEAYLEALRILGGLYAGEGDIASSVDCLKRAIEVDPLREELHGDLIRLFGVSGRIPEALRQYEKLERLLKEKLEIAPSEAIKALMESIRHVDLAPPAGTGVSGAAPRSRDESSPGPAIDEGSLRVSKDERASIREPSPATLREPSPATLREPSPEPPGGAVPLDSPFYVERETDAEFHEAIRRGDSIVLVKGPRQVGKTSLLARAFDRARRGGVKVVCTDLQKLTSSQLESADSLFYTFAEAIQEQLGLDESPEESWNPHRGWNVNFERYLRREVLGKVAGPIIWGLDEVDRLFHAPYRNEVFGLFRSWHNERSLDPGGPWRSLTLAVAYATEAHLFITDLNQSPFNVGTRLQLRDFTPEQVADLNGRYGAPLSTETERERFIDLVGGHPYLVRRGLHLLAKQAFPFERIDAEADDEEGVFGDHLARIRSSLSLDPELREAIRSLLEGEPFPSEESFHRLRSAGILDGSFPEKVAFRCRLYERYLRRRLP